MKLTAEQFAELAATFDAKQSRTQHERRRATRMDLQARIKITPVVDGRNQNSLTVTICDFSARGIAFIDQNPMEMGQQFILELPRREGGPVTLLCTVMHKRHVGHDIYRMGAEFTCGLNSSGSIQHSNSSESSETQRIRASMLG